MLSEKEKPGLWGEIYAARFMRENGYEIITANYRCRLGEIDIIAKRMAFGVHRGQDPLARRDSSGARSGRQRKAGADNRDRFAFYAENNYDLQPRFDVAEVTLGKENEPISCEYIENAFDSSF